MRITRIEGVALDILQKAQETGCKETVNDYNNLVHAIRFIENVYEIAFGNDAHKKGFTPEEVIHKLREFSDDALKYENSLAPFIREDIVMMIREEHLREDVDFVDTVMESIENGFDANDGINWDVIEFHIGQVREGWDNDK